MTFTGFILCVIASVLFGVLLGLIAARHDREKAGVLAAWKVYVYRPQKENRRWSPRPVYRYLYGRSYTARLWFFTVSLTNARLRKDDAARGRTATGDTP